MKLLRTFTALAFLLAVKASEFEGECLTGCFDKIEGPITLEVAHSIKPKSGCLVYGMVKKVPVEVIDYVLDNGLADVNAFDCYGRCSLTYALGEKDYAAADALFAHGVDVNASIFSTPLVMVIQSGSYNEEEVIEAVNYLLGRGADPHLVGKSGYSPLIAAAKRGNVELVKMFLDLGLDPNHQNSYGETALHEAVCNREDDVEVVKLLLDRGADIRIKDKHGETPLFHALRCRQYAIFEFLLQHGAGLSVLHEQNKKGNTVANLFRNELLYCEREQEKTTEILSRYI
jgi:ankyrin repeat protein